MTILINNLLLTEFHNFSDLKLKEKVLNSLKKFENFFTSPDNFDVKKVQRIVSDETDNLFALKITPKFKLIFKVEIDRDAELNIMLLEMKR